MIDISKFRNQLKKNCEIFEFLSHNFLINTRTRKVGGQRH